MTIKRTRELLGSLVADMSDEEVARMIETYSTIADMILLALKQARSKPTNSEYNAKL